MFATWIRGSSRRAGSIPPGCSGDPWSPSLWRLSPWRPWELSQRPCGMCIKAPVSLRCITGKRGCHVQAPAFEEHCDAGARCERQRRSGRLPNIPDTLRISPLPPLTAFVLQAITDFVSLNVSGIFPDFQHVSWINVCTASQAVEGLSQTFGPKS